MIQITEAVIMCLLTFVAGLVFGYMIYDAKHPNLSGILDYQFREMLKKEGVRLNIHVTSEDINKYFRDDMWMST